MRTTIDIDKNLIEEALKLSKISTKKEYEEIFSDLSALHYFEENIILPLSYFSLFILYRDGRPALIYILFSYPLLF